ncbi:unnamed protein product [Durusdinium trenchii]
MGMWSGIRRSPQFRAAASGAKPGVRLATSEQIVGFTIKEYKGLVMGSTVRAKDVTKDITSAITAVFGGELPHYTQLMQDAREEAMSRLEDEAVKLGANAVVSLRLSSTNIAACGSHRNTDCISRKHLSKHVCSPFLRLCCTSRDLRTVTLHTVYHVFA